MTAERLDQLFNETYASICGPLDDQLCGSNEIDRDKRLVWLAMNKLVLVIKAELGIPNV